jgi:hypothetical protein
MKRWRDRLDRFLFVPVDGYAAAWFRIAFAAVLPYLFWSGGLSPPDAPSSIERLYDDVFLTFGYWFTALALCVLLAFGWRPRAIGSTLALVLFPLAFVPGATRSRQVILTALVAFCFLRSDVVRWPRLRQERQAVPSSAGPAWPIRLVQLQLTLLYGVNAIAKASPAYLSGDVLTGMALALPNFKAEVRFGAIDLGVIAVPVMVAGIAGALTEGALAIGFWLGRWKWLAALLGIAFHLYLRFIIDIYKLDVATVFLYLAFLLPLVRPSPKSSAPT